MFQKIEALLSLKNTCVYIMSNKETFKITNKQKKDTFKTKVTRKLEERDYKILLITTHQE